MKNILTLCSLSLLCALNSSPYSSMLSGIQARRAVKSTLDSASVTLQLNYTGAEALIDALERDSLSDTDVDNLVRIPALRAMVDNVTRFVPGIGVSEFRKEIQSFVQTKKGGIYQPYFQFDDVWRERARVRILVTAIRTDERKIADETLSQLERYRPNSGSLSITVYFVAGGVSTGFVFDNDSKSFYANLVRANGDLNGVIANMMHETYHVMQNAAQRRAGITAFAYSDEKTPPAEKLVAGVLSEGTANYVADPTRSTATGPDMESARERYRRNAQPERIKENFRLFDSVLKDLREGRITWDDAYIKGFTSRNDDSFYFVGYEMAKALDRYCGRKYIGRLFEKPPVEFFRRYIALYRKHHEIKGRFSRETETFIAGYATKS